MTDHVHPFPGNVLRHSNRIAGDYDSQEDERLVTGKVDHANLLTSELDTSAFPGMPAMHRPVLDIDWDVTLLPSTTTGHHHLLINRAITWDQYRALLTALATAGIIEEGFAGASQARGYSAVRLPWVKKESDEPC